MGTCAYLVPSRTLFLLSQEGVASTQGVLGSAAPAVSTATPKVIYSQALYCLDIVACTVPFWFRFFPPCLFLFFIFLRVAKYLRRNCTEKQAVYLHANKVQ